MKYGFIGCGNMGGAIATALSRHTRDILVSDRSGKAASLAKKLGIGYSSNQQIAQLCDCIFIGVKPHMVRECLEPLWPVLEQRKPMLVSMAAGVTLAQIETFAAAELPVIRIMPNTPTAVGAGVIPYCCNGLVTDPMLERWLRDMAACGTVERAQEQQMDGIGALSGSGPAYLYVLLEAMADGGVACGIPREQALRYAAATMLGAAETYLQTGIHPGALKDAVCSPGGSTIEGLRVLEERGVRGAMMDCIRAAYEKNQKLGK